MARDLRNGAEVPRSGGSRVAVILVNYRGAEDTLRAAASLAASRHRDYALLVVENGSGDGSEATLAARLDLHGGALIVSPENLGFAGGCNLALERVRREGFEYVLLLNNDAVLEPEALGRLIAASRRLDDRAILGCLVRYEGAERVQFAGSRTDPRFGIPVWLDPETLDLADPEALIASDFIFGAALFAPVAAFEEVGLLDEAFFLDFEETDFCYRARRAGWTCQVVVGAVAHHRSGAALGIYDGPLQSYFLVRNELLFAERWASPAQRRRLYLQRAREFWWRLRDGLRDGDPLPPPTRCRLLAIRDYLLRRFGDCPAVVRRYAAAAPRVDESSRVRIAEAA